ncbi:glutamate--cysteine ligase [Ignatzschineria sp. LJL83]
MDKLQSRLQHNLELLGKHQAKIADVNIGLERETLRINPETGHLSDQDHPESIGSALTHKHITTDFAECMLEFVTSPHSSPDKALEELRSIQKFTLNKLNNEIFWPNSMPPAIDSEDEIVIGKYGSSNDARMKSLYRKGLSVRYGKMMQVISGIHYNFSLEDHVFKAFQDGINNNDTLSAFKTDRYLHACRNVSRYGFVIPYFLGASPVMDKSFLAGKENPFSSLNDEDSYLPEGESLRLSDIGYGNNKCHFDVSFNSIQEFTKNIQFAISTPCNIFSQIPVQENGIYNQINNHILQIENEYYASIRPKQIMQKGENFLTALNKRGIEYIELRSVDINPLIAEGIDIDSMRFIQLFLTASVLTDAENLSQKEYEHNQKNLKIVAKSGLDLDQSFTVEGEESTLKEALLSALHWLDPIAKILGSPYEKSLSLMKDRVSHPELLPASEVLKALKTSNQTYQSFFLAKAKTLYSSEYSALDSSNQAALESLTEQSLAKRDEIEAAPQIPFAEYLENYFKF